MKLIRDFYTLAKKALSNAVAFDRILSLGWSDKIIKVKYDIPNDKPEMFDEYEKAMTADFEGLTEVA